MKKLIISLGVIAGMLLLSGCVSPNMKERPTMITKVKGRHYVVPKSSYSDWKPIPKTRAKKYNKAIGNIMKCRAGDIIVTSAPDTETKISSESFDTYMAKAKKAVQVKGRSVTSKDMSIILNSVFKDVYGRAIREGKIMCVHPQPWSWTNKRNRYEAQQRRINNDPRVVAARIQANAIRQAENNRINASKWDLNTNYFGSTKMPSINLNELNNLSGVNTSSYSPVNTSGTYRATKVGDGLYRVKKTQGGGVQW